MKAWFLSDLHLRDPEERSSHRLLRFLLSIESKERHATHLFLLGDIFDVWVGGGSAFVQKWTILISALKRIQKMGIEIFFFEGNHDVHIASFWKKKFGASVFTKEQSLRLGPYLLHLEHGDLINQQDLAYLRYRTVLRSLPLQIFASLAPSKFLLELGHRMSHHSSLTSRAPRIVEPKVLEMQNEKALRLREHQPIDFFIAGHFHIRQCQVLNSASGAVVSVNLGSWFEEPAVFSIETDPSLKYGFTELGDSPK